MNIRSQELISEHSILKTIQSPLSITISIPDFVLTGTRYDFDVILDNPLEGAIIAGGLIQITPEQIDKQISPEIELSPLGGGGLFKTVQAPLKPGKQAWAAMIAHPKGLISITKMVHIVSNPSELQP